MLFTANLKSDKNSERQELPPEIAREFEQNNIEVKYNPVEESYDIMLARLQEKDGSVVFSEYDLTITLPTFARAMAEIQEAYTGALSAKTATLAGASGISGKPQGLKKFVLTQGSVENILDAWKIEKKIGAGKLSFVEFLDQRFKTALTFKEYSLPDRLLVAKILSSKGLLRTITPADIDLPSDTFAVSASKAGKNKEEIIAESVKVKKYSVLDLAKLDPFNLRGKQAQAVADSFKKKTRPEAGGELNVELGEDFNLEKQVNDQLDILGRIGILELNGEMPPTLAQIQTGFAENPQFFKEKIKQGFTKLIIVPAGAGIEVLRQKYAQLLRNHASASTLFGEGAPGVSALNAGKALNTAEPVYKWDGYDKQQMVYLPTSFDKNNHGGLTKDEFIAQRGAWQVLLVEETPIPRKGRGQIINGRKQLEAELSPIGYLGLIKGDPMYTGEEGMTPELSLMKYITRLEQLGEVTDDYAGKGSINYNVGTFFPSSGLVAASYWNRGSSRANLNWTDSSIVGVFYGASSAVRIPIRT
jgi:hypothetical protein